MVWDQVKGHATGRGMSWRAGGGSRARQKKKRNSIWTPRPSCNAKQEGTAGVQCQLFYLLQGHRA